MLCYASEMDTCCHWNDVGTQQEAKPARGFVSDLNVHVDLGINPSLLGWWFTLLRNKIENIIFI